MGDAIPSTKRTPSFVKWLPLILVELFLWSTYLLFWTTIYPQGISNPWVLSFFVFSAYFALFLGYWAFIRSLRGRNSWQAFSLPRPRRNFLMSLSAIHLMTYGLATLVEFNCFDISSIREALSNPGGAYAAKFIVYEDQANLSHTNFAIQLVVINFWLYYFGLIGITYWWNDILLSVRVFFVISIFIYLLAFACMGTQKGLADVLLLCGVGLLLRYSAHSLVKTRLEKIRYLMPSLYYAVIPIILFLAYVIFIQSSRSDHFKISDQIAEDAKNSIWGDLFNIQIAVFVNSIANYASQGYAGLANSLTQDYVFSYGYGICPSAHSYLQQYCGIPDFYASTYLARSELATGWPGLMYWSTAFPWWGSDLSFPGSVLLMVVIGWTLAVVWVSALQRRSIAAIVILGLLFETLFYIIANNQVFYARTGLWSAAAVLFFYFFEMRRPRFRGQKSSKECS